MKNDKTPGRGIIKKMSFLWVVCVVYLIHVLVKTLNIESSMETSIIAMLWVVGVLIACFCAKYEFNDAYREKMQLLSKAKCDIKESKKGYQKDIMDLMEQGFTTQATVEGVYEVGTGMASTRADFVIIEYSFCNENGTKFYETKRFHGGTYIFAPSIPCVGNKLDVVCSYDDPPRSIIISEKAKKVQWYQQQRKYQIKVSN